MRQDEGFGRILKRQNASKTLRDMLREGPFTLSLSAGFFGFYAHAGLVSVLEEEGLRPARLTGCSAGALIGGLWASGCRMADLSDFLFSIKRTDFWDPSLGWGLLAGNRFDDILRSLLQCTYFEDAELPIQMTLFDVSTRKTEYVETGDLALAIRASCAFPGLFQPVQIGQRRFLDGGILDRSSLGGMTVDQPIFYHRLKSRSKLSLGAPPVHTHRITEFCIDGLPRVSPFHLERGPAAFEHAKSAMRQRLDQEILLASI